VGLYSDGGEIPGAELFSEGASATGGNDWYGPSGLSFVLTPGTYWVTFEVRPGDTFRGGMPNGAPFPLGNEAFTNGGMWFEFDTLDIGVRIRGDLTAVPEPSAVGLMLLGLVGIGRMGRQKQN
jgi:hypothetical protein